MGAALDARKFDEAAKDATPELKARFGAITTTPEIYNEIVAMSEYFLKIALAFTMLTPSSRERSEALTCLEDAKMWAVKALSRHGLRHDYEVDAEDNNEG